MPCVRSVRMIKQSTACKGQGRQFPSAKKVIFCGFTPVIIWFHEARRGIYELSRHKLFSSKHPKTTKF
ncbi:hypothetical protein MT325_m728R [Paramecium bursaria chlorella virus MT325]|uniref:Uncharacterized protein m728R n=1 Tax=Paramecium bursaria Chlorella virus MT325 TaxID=346932 RepID=A7IVA8_PBCVM|nr:hypothetical protein MT325_m728R [Paramecium bursaria chlorella virus MT325]